MSNVRGSEVSEPEKTEKRQSFGSSCATSGDRGEETPETHLPKGAGKDLRMGPKPGVHAEVTKTFRKSNTKPSEYSGLRLASRRFLSPCTIRKRIRENGTRSRRLRSLRPLVHQSF